MIKFKKIIIFLFFFEFEIGTKLLSTKQFEWGLLIPICPTISNQRCPWNQIMENPYQGVTPVLESS